MSCTASAFLGLAEPVYIVSGSMRSCTSMMMGCLKAGGMEIVYNEDRKERMRHLSDENYSMNSEFYELNPGQFRNKGFPLMHVGKVIKILFPGIKRLPRGSYKIIMMLRHPVEIHASYLAAYEQIVDRNYLLGRRGMGEYPTSPQSYHAWWKRERQRAMKRNMDVLTVGARTVNKWPLRQFVRIRDAGWPIDPELAAAAVDISKYRFKLAELTARHWSWESAQSF